MEFNFCFCSGLPNFFLFIFYSLIWSSSLQICLLLAWLHLQKDFIGREALLKQKEEGVKQMLVQLVVGNHDVEYDLLPWGGEPIYRDNVYVGRVTTACYGFSMERPVSIMDSCNLSRFDCLWSLIAYFLIPFHKKVSKRETASRIDYSIYPWLYCWDFSKSPHVFCSKWRKVVRAPSVYTILCNG